VSATLLGTGSWAQALAERDFEARGTAWSRGAFRATIQGGWLVLRAPAPESALDLLASDAGWPGLWRLAPAEGGGLARVFELPPTLVARIERSPDEHAAALATLDWALESATLHQPIATLQQPSPTLQHRSATLQRGPGLAGLQPGPSGSGAEVGWSPSLSPDQSVRSGPLVAQIKASQESSVFELSLSARATSGLGAGRDSWMRALLSDARARWRLARCLLVDGVPSARVDLRGAPSAIQGDVTAAALDALRQVGSWLLEPLDLVLDPGLDSPALDAGAPVPDRSPRRARPASSRRARPAPSQENHHGSLDDSPH